MSLSRRSLLALVALTAVTSLAGCGFQLRASQSYGFDTIAVTPERSGGVAADLARYLGDRVRPVAPGTGGTLPDVILDILEDTREKVVVGMNASGQVREFELRLKVRFKLRSPKGEELIAASTIAQRRSISFNESAVLAKEAEETLLYRDMQADVVQQLLRRLAAVKPVAQ
jgi:LPS-assembly lipoprotein